MKSSSEKFRFIKDYYQIIIKPSQTINKIMESPINLIKTFIIVCISSILLVSGVFLMGGTAYNIFFEQYSSFILERLTSGQLFGYYLSRDQYLLVFFSEFIFCIKAWIFIAIVFYIFLRFSKQEINIKKVLEINAWSIFPFSWILFIISLISYLFKFILPLIFHYIFYGSILIIFIVLVPYWMLKFSEKLNIESPYLTFRSYYLTLVVVFILYTITHYNVFLLQIM
ncbi:MAG: hypothetical protein ACTSPY_17710 [Candidatus Helarchaeota archaeon]